jgi:hypothetical protein
LNAALDLEIAAVVPFPQSFRVISHEIVKKYRYNNRYGSGISTGAVYNDSAENDSVFFQFHPVSERKSIRVSTANQFFLKAV